MAHHAHHHVEETPPLHDPIDPWHDHTKDEKPQHAHAEVGNARAIIGIGVGLFMIIVLSVVAVYAYYTWYLARRLSEVEIASGQTSPAIQARVYKQTALTRLDKGASVVIPPAGEDVPGVNYTITPIEGAIDRTAREYAR